MDDEKIVLDRKSFEALAVDTRVKILKSLKQRRKTLTEIAKEEGMSVSGIKEHLSVLESVGLIEKIDDGHKSKYYELTKKGREVVGPKEVKVLIVLSTSILALLISLLFMLGPAAAPMGAQTRRGPATAGATASTGPGGAGGDADAAVRIAPGGVGGCRTGKPAQAASRCLQWQDGRPCHVGGGGRVYLAARCPSRFLPHCSGSAEQRGQARPGQPGAGEPTLPARPGLPLDPR